MNKFALIAFAFGAEITAASARPVQTQEIHRVAATTPAARREINEIVPVLEELPEEPEFIQVGELFDIPQTCQFGSEFISI